MDGYHVLHLPSQALCKDPARVPAATEECLRYDSAGLFNYRFTTRETEWAGLEIRPIRSWMRSRSRFETLSNNLTRSVKSKALDVGGSYIEPENQVVLRHRRLRQSKKQGSGRGSKSCRHSLHWGATITSTFAWLSAWLRSAGGGELVTRMSIALNGAIWAKAL